MKKLMIAAAAVFVSAGAAMAQDAAAGATVFKKCMACHKVGEGAKNAVGPHLNGIIGRAAASVEGYAYSEPAKAKAASTGEWSVEEIVEYLVDPAAFYKGPSKMTFKLADETERKNVAAYLATFGADGKTK
ncbi:MAG: c-type cytochrome [Hyphomicrobiaceae bacterium]|nr:c-type cytochrome [Hyphomicrobiaceae bacterium]